MRIALDTLSALDEIQVAAPCTADWDHMPGDSRVRFCAQCHQQVYNLSAMSADQAMTLLRERPGDVRVRLYQRMDGTLITADCPIGIRRHPTPRPERWVTVALVAFFAIMLLVFSWGPGRAWMRRFADVVFSPLPPVLGGGPAQTPVPCPAPSITMGKI